MNSSPLVPESYKSVDVSLKERKCGLGLVNSVKINLDKFTPKQQVEIKKLLQRPDLQTSIVSNSGRFRIHFDTTGSDAPSYNSLLSPYQNALEVGKALDSAYNFEVNYLGYLPPPSDNGQGGDNLLDIYILRIGPGYYGITQWEDVIDEVNQTYTSFIEIDPAFGTEFYTHGLNAMHITVAHELHHTIQIGNYTNRYNEEGFFYELTSTSMEEFVYDDVNDYYGYLKDYFYHPETPLSETDGYSAATWNIFLQQRFGNNVIKRQWELMPSLRAMYAINAALFEYNSSFKKEFNKYGVWMNFTGFRAVPGSYFEEAANYPLVKQMIIKFSQSHPPVELSSKAASHIFLTYVNTTNNDSLVVVISNGDVASAVNYPYNFFNTQYTLYLNSVSGDRYLTENYSSTFEADNMNFWSVSEILNGLVVREDSVVNTYLDISDSFIFPNPFRYRKNDGIYISLNAKSGETVELNIYSVSMELMYKSLSEVSLISQNNTVGITWNGLDLYGNKLASGVYIYIIKKGNDILKGKFVVFN